MIVFCGPSKGTKFTMLMMIYIKVNNESYVILKSKVAIDFILSVEQNSA